MSGTSYEDLNTFYCHRRHKLAIKVLLRSAQNFHIVSSDMQLNSTRRRQFFLRFYYDNTRARHNGPLYAFCHV